jgi:hypothetical protein
MGMSAEGDQLLKEACNIRQKLEPQDSRLVDELEESDLDVLVAFWSR